MPKIKIYNSFLLKKDFKKLINQKKKNNLNIILCFPCLEGENIRVLSNELKISQKACQNGLLDKVCLIFSGPSNSSIVKMAKNLGTEVVLSSEVSVPDMSKTASSDKGKGADMRRFLYFAYHHFFKTPLKKNIVGFIDADIKPNAFGLHYLIGLFGPFINNSQVKFTKLVYRRKKGFGRVNEILAQPIVSLFKNYRLSFLSSIPYLLSGEVAFRGDFILEKKFIQRYGIEIYILLQTVLDKNFKSSYFALSNVGFMDHKHQSLSNLRSMSFGILKIWLKALEDYKLINFSKKIKLSEILNYALIENKNNQISYYQKDLSEKIYQPLIKVIK